MYDSHKILAQESFKRRRSYIICMRQLKSQKERIKEGDRNAKRYPKTDRQKSLKLWMLTEIQKLYQIQRNQNYQRRHRVARKNVSPMYP